MKAYLATFLLPLAAYGQLMLATGDCTTGTPVNSGSVFDFGPVAAGTTKTVTFLVCNPGNTPVSVTPIPPAGAGFSLVGASTTSVDPPMNARPISLNVQFCAVTPDSYSASLQVNSINILLLATAVPAPVLSSSSPCSGPVTIDFGSVADGTSSVHNLSLQNPYTLPLTISAVAVNAGAGFQVTTPPLPAVIAPGGTLSLALQLAPVCGTTFYSGTLSIDSQTFALSGTGFVPPTPTPILTFDAASFGSNEQHTLALSFPSAYPCPAVVVSGNLNLTFTPGVDFPPGDSTVIFVPSNAPTISFTLGSDRVHFLFGTQSNAVFNTGSTAGTIAFSLADTAVEIPDITATFPIAPTAISIDTATASNQILGQLDVSIAGYDNTYTAGRMLFTFFDTSGNAIGAPVNADFTRNFTNYFSSYSTNCKDGQPCGSTFLARVSFQVTGPQTQVASVAVTLTNTAGQTQTGKLTFQ